MLLKVKIDLAKMCSFIFFHDKITEKSQVEKKLEEKTETKSKKIFKPFFEPFLEQNDQFSSFLVIFSTLVTRLQAKN